MIMLDQVHLLAHFFSISSAFIYYQAKHFYTVFRFQKHCFKGHNVAHEYSQARPPTGFSPAALAHLTE